ncbi:hypothetical protein JCM8547_005064 [Rhodosporidiobolus lusitaniae]
MPRQARFLAMCALLAATAVRAEYSLVKAYEGKGFFDDWTFWGNYDNLTGGDVDYVAASGGSDLAYVNSAGRAIIKVDNTTDLLYPNKRRSVRIETKETYPIGSLWIFDAYHVPYGCSTWPAMWSSAPNWPQGGEIDTFETVNLQEVNRMAMHTTEDCAAQLTSANPFTGNLTFPVCDSRANYNSGCGIEEVNTASSGEAFASAGGGVWVTEMGVEGVKIWFFSRSDVPADLLNASSIPNPSSWPTPSASYSEDICDVADHFAPQHLVLNIALCGELAGNAGVRNETGCPATNSDGCYINYVLDKRNYDTAYFELASVRIYHNPDKAANSSTAALDGFPEDQAVAGQYNSSAGRGVSGAGAIGTVMALGGLFFLV